MAAPTKPASVKKALANSEPSTHGTQRTFKSRKSMAAFGAKRTFSEPRLPTRASGASQSTSKRLVLLTSTPHALKQLEPDQPPSETAAATTNVGRTRQFWSRRRRGRQGRAFGAPLRDLGALTALRRREVGLPSCRGSLSVTRSDVSDLAPLAQSASACLCKTLQNASICFKSLQNRQCKSMHFRAKKCFGMLRNVAFCCVHTCALLGAILL